LNIAGAAMDAEGLVRIPLVDVRDGGPLRHASEGAARARALRDACLSFFPRAVRPFVPLLDHFARRWFERSASPYVEEIAAIAKALGFPGIWFLNASYQWGCTTLAREEGGKVWLVRTLDWPFPGLGRHAEVAHLRGPAGSFLSITWPGYVGALTVSAPGRFAAALNQAPMRRRSRARALRLYDCAENVVYAYRNVRHMPPDQLLRRACETCRSFEEARTLLETTPVSRPAIFTLAGIEKGQRCVIERTEEAFSTHDHDTCVANDWLASREGWEARVGGRLILTCTFAEAAENSRARREALAAWRGDPERGDFEWVKPPILNPFTRLAAVMCPATGLLRAVGYERVRGCELPQPVTRVCEVTASLVAA
jgi:hypothetical protein